MQQFPGVCKAKLSSELISQKSAQTEHSGMLCQNRRLHFRRNGPNGCFWRGQGSTRLVGLSTPAAGFGACPTCSPCLPPPHCHHRFPLGHCKFILGLRKSPTHNSVNNHQDPYSGVLRIHATITSTRIFEWACCLLRGAKLRGEILSGSTVFNAVRGTAANF